MIRASRPGTAHKTIGGSLIIAGYLFLILALQNHRLPVEIRTVLLLLGFPVSCLGAFLFWRGCKYAAKATAERILAADLNSHVLYLRAFRSDASTRRFVLSTAAMTPWPQVTLEEQSAEVLRPFGDLVAIGQPGEDLPEPGAARMYASDDEWKEVVSRQLRAARLVIIRAGVGENLLCEAKHAVETLSPEKVLIFVFLMNAKDYESFSTKAIQTLALSLPELATLRPCLGRVSGFIGFAADWKPSVLPPPRSRYLLLRTPPFKPNLAYLKFALRPVFERFGLEWWPPPLQMAAPLVMIAIVVFPLLMRILFQ